MMSMVFERGRAAAAGALAGVVLATVAACPVVAHPHVWVANEARMIFENGALTALRYRWLFDEMYTASAIEGLDKNNDGKLDASELEELTQVNIEGLKEFDYFTAATMAGKPVQFGDARDFGMELVMMDEPPGPQMVAGPVTSAADTQQGQPARAGLWARFSGWWSGLFSRQPTTTAKAGPPPDKAIEKSKVLALSFTLPLKEPLPAGSLVGDSKGFQFQLNDAQMFIWFEPAGKDAIGLAPGAPAGCRHAMVEPHMDDEQKKVAEAFSKVGGMTPGGQGRAIAVICAKP